jgi:hypothetical protein
LGAKYGFGKSTRKRLGTWVQESLHEHNFLDYTKVDTMQSAFLWYFFVYKPNSLVTAINQVLYLKGPLYETRKEALNNTTKYGKDKSLNIFQFIFQLKKMFTGNNDNIVNNWENEIKLGNVPDPDILPNRKKEMIKDITNKSEPNFSRIEKYFKKALWFGIDSNDIVEMNALISLASLDDLIKYEENEFKKLIQDLIHFNYTQQPGTIKVFYGNELYKFLEKQNFVYSEYNLEYSKLYFSIIKNLPSNIEYNEKENLNELIKKLTKTFLSKEYTADVLKDNEGLQLVLTHILSLNEWNNEFKLKYSQQIFSDNFFKFQNQKLLAIFEKSPNNLPELKNIIYTQKSECSILLKLEVGSLITFVKFLETQDQTHTFKAISFLHFRYLLDKTFEEKNDLFKTTNFEDWFSENSKNKEFLFKFEKNFKEQIFKEFDY